MQQEVENIVAEGNKLQEKAAEGIFDPAAKPAGQVHGDPHFHYCVIMHDNESSSLISNLSTATSTAVVCCSIHLSAKPGSDSETISSSDCESPTKSVFKDNPVPSLVPHVHISSKPFTSEIENGYPQSSVNASKNISGPKRRASEMDDSNDDKVSDDFIHSNKFVSIN